LLLLKTPTVARLGCSAPLSFRLPLRRCSLELDGYVIEGAQGNPVCVPSFLEVSVPQSEMLNGP